eukprot:COSAG02_NODE_3872_length_6114_cov_14.174730_5_plen_142_part_00
MRAPPAPPAGPARAGRCGEAAGGRRVTAVWNRGQAQQYRKAGVVPVVEQGQDLEQGQIQDLWLYLVKCSTRGVIAGQPATCVRMLMARRAMAVAMLGQHTDNNTRTAPEEWSGAIIVVGQKMLTQCFRNRRAVVAALALHR